MAVGNLRCYGRTRNVLSGVLMWSISFSTKKKNDQIFSCFRNGVNRHRARSIIFASKLYPQGCSPDTIIDVLLAYDKSLIAIDCDYDRVLNGYMSIKNKLRVIQQILLTAESADSD